MWNREKVKWAVESFESYKFHGVDGIYPGFIKVGLEPLFGKSLGLGYIPKV